LRRRGSAADKQRRRQQEAWRWTIDGNDVYWQQDTAVAAAVAAMAAAAADDKFERLRQGETGRETAETADWGR